MPSDTLERAPTLTAHIPQATGTALMRNPRFVDSGWHFHSVHGFHGLPLAQD